MEEENKVIETTEVSEVIEEIKNASEDDLEATIKKWFESTRTDGMRLGSKYISMAVLATIRKHTSKPGKTSLRDYERMTKALIDMVNVPLELGTKETTND